MERWQDVQLRLKAFLRDTPAWSARWEGAKVFEWTKSTPIDPAGRPVIPQSKLLDSTAYAARFGALLSGGYPWINVSCYGLLRGEPLLAVELPQYTITGSTQASVRISGPAMGVVEAGWDATSAVIIL